MLHMPWQGGMEHILFVEVGFGNDQHGQNATKACVRYVSALYHRNGPSWYIYI